MAGVIGFQVAGCRASLRLLFRIIHSLKIFNSCRLARSSFWSSRINSRILCGSTTVRNENPVWSAFVSSANTFQIIWFDKFSIAIETLQNMNIQLTISGDSLRGLFENSLESLGVKNRFLVKKYLFSVSFYILKLHTFDLELPSGRIVGPTFGFAITCGAATVCDLLPESRWDVHLTDARLKDLLGQRLVLHLPKLRSF